MMTFQEKVNKRKKEIENTEKLKQKYEKAIAEIKANELFKILPSWIKNIFKTLEQAQEIYVEEDINEVE